MAKRLTAKRRSKYATQQARVRTNRDYHETHRRQPSVWSQMSDRERAEWLREAAKRVG